MSVIELLAQIRYAFEEANPKVLIPKTFSEQKQKVLEVAINDAKVNQSSDTLLNLTKIWTRMLSGSDTEAYTKCIERLAKNSDLPIAVRRRLQGQSGEGQLRFTTTSTTGPARLCRVPFYPIRDENAWSSRFVDIDSATPSRQSFGIETLGDDPIVSIGPFLGNQNSNKISSIQMKTQKVEFGSYRLIGMEINANFGSRYIGAVKPGIQATGSVEVVGALAPASTSITNNNIPAAQATGSVEAVGPAAVQSTLNITHDGALGSQSTGSVENVGPVAAQASGSIQNTGPVATASTGSVQNVGPIAALASGSIQNTGPVAAIASGSIVNNNTIAAPATAALTVIGGDSTASTGSIEFVDPSATATGSIEVQNDGNTAEVQMQIDNTEATASGSIELTGTTQNAISNIRFQDGVAATADIAFGTPADRIAQTDLALDSRFSIVHGAGTGSATRELYVFSNAATSRTTNVQVPALSGIFYTVYNIQVQGSYDRTMSELENAINGVGVAASSLVSASFTAGNQITLSADKTLTLGISGNLSRGMITVYDGGNIGGTIDTANFDPFFTEGLNSTSPLYNAGATISLAYDVSLPVNEALDQCEIRLLEQAASTTYSFIFWGDTTTAPPSNTGTIFYVDIRTRTNTTAQEFTIALNDFLNTVNANIAGYLIHPEYLKLAEQTLFFRWVGSVIGPNTESGFATFVGNAGTAVQQTNMTFTYAQSGGSQDLPIDITLNGGAVTRAYPVTDTPGVMEFISRSTADAQTVSFEQNLFLSGDIPPGDYVQYSTPTVDSLQLEVSGNITTTLFDVSQYALSPNPPISTLVQSGSAFVLDYGAYFSITSIGPAGGETILLFAADLGSGVPGAYIPFTVTSDTGVTATNLANAIIANAPDLNVGVIGSTVSLDQTYAGRVGNQAITYNGFQGGIRPEGDVTTLSGFTGGVSPIGNLDSFTLRNASAVDITFIGSDGLAAETATQFRTDLSASDTYNSILTMFGLNTQFTGVIGGASIFNIEMVDGIGSVFNAYPVTNNGNGSILFKNASDAGFIANTTFDGGTDAIANGTTLTVTDWNNDSSTYIFGTDIPLSGFANTTASNIQTAIFNDVTIEISAVINGGNDRLVDLTQGGAGEGGNTTILINPAANVNVINFSGGLGVFPINESITIQSASGNTETYFASLYTTDDVNFKVSDLNGTYGELISAIAAYNGGAGLGVTGTINGNVLDLEQNDFGSIGDKPITQSANGTAILTGFAGGTDDIAPNTELTITDSTGAFAILVAGTDFDVGGSTFNLRASIVQAINDAGLALSAAPAGLITRIDITQNAFGTVGNGKNLTIVASTNKFKVLAPFAGGVDNVAIGQTITLVDHLGQTENFESIDTGAPNANQFLVVQNNPAQTMVNLRDAINAFGVNLEMTATLNGLSVDLVQNGFGTSGNTVIGGAIGGLTLNDFAGGVDNVAIGQTITLEDYLGQTEDFESIDTGIPNANQFLVVQNNPNQTMQNLATAINNFVAPLRITATPIGTNISLSQDGYGPNGDTVIAGAIGGLNTIDFTGGAYNITPNSTLNLIDADNPAQNKTVRFVETVTLVDDVLIVQNNPAQTMQNLANKINGYNTAGTLNISAVAANTIVNFTQETFGSQGDTVITSSTAELVATDFSGGADNITIGQTITLEDYLGQTEDFESIDTGAPNANQFLVVQNDPAQTMQNLSDAINAFGLSLRMTANLVGTTIELTQNSFSPSGNTVIAGAIGGLTTTNFTGGIYNITPNSTLNLIDADNPSQNKTVRFVETVVLPDDVLIVQNNPAQTMQNLANKINGYDAAGTLNISAIANVNTVNFTQEAFGPQGDTVITSSTAEITSVDFSGGSYGVTPGGTLTLSDGNALFDVFQAVSTPGAVTPDFTVDQLDPAQTMVNLRDAINTSGIGMSAIVDGGNPLNLIVTQDRFGTIGNKATTDTIVGITAPASFTGGIDNITANETVNLIDAGGLTQTVRFVDNITLPNDVLIVQEDPAQTMVALQNKVNSFIGLGFLNINATAVGTTVNFEQIGYGPTGNTAITSSNIAELQSVDFSGGLYNVTPGESLTLSDYDNVNTDTFVAGVDYAIDQANPGNTMSNLGAAISAALPNIIVNVVGLDIQLTQNQNGPKGNTNVFATNAPAEFTASNFTGGTYSVELGSQITIIAADGTTETFEAIDIPQPPPVGIASYDVEPTILATLNNLKTAIDGSVLAGKVNAVVADPFINLEQATPGTNGNTPISITNDALVPTLVPTDFAGGVDSTINLASPLSPIAVSVRELSVYNGNNILIVEDSESVSASEFNILDDSQGLSLTYSTGGSIINPEGQTAHPMSIESEDRSYKFIGFRDQPVVDPNSQVFVKIESFIGSLPEWDTNGGATPYPADTPLPKIPPVSFSINLIVDLLEDKVFGDISAPSPASRAAANVKLSGMDVGDNRIIIKNSTTKKGYE